MKKIKCPHCSAKLSDKQPTSGTHAWEVVYTCGYSETHSAGGVEDISNNCPHQQYKGYTPIHVYVEENDIQTPQRGSIEYSDMYVDIYKKFDKKILHTWNAIEPDDRNIKRMMLFYSTDDLKSYFKCKNS